MLRLMRFYLLMKCKMAVSADYRRLLKKEAKAYTICQKSFKKQEKFLMENLEEMYTKYTVNISLAYNHLSQASDLYPKKDRKTDYSEEPLWGFRREMWIDEMIHQLEVPISKGAEKGYKSTWRRFQKILLENAFVYSFDPIINYVRDRGNLQLSNYRWTISHTTKEWIVGILKEGIDNNWTYNQVRDKIVQANSKLFWKARARTIAVTEMAKAYEYGNVQPMRQLQSVGIPILKKWQTCDDGKVRPEHMECEHMERVPLDFVYPSVNVAYPPWGVNCRCTILYKVNE